VVPPSVVAVTVKMVTTIVATKTVAKERQRRPGNRNETIFGNFLLQ